MTKAHWTSVVSLTALLLCSSHSTWGADKAKSAFDEFDGSYEQSYAEVPCRIDSAICSNLWHCQRNYVVEKNDDALFQQAIKGMVSGLDRYSRYLSPEDYKQLLQYTEGDMCECGFQFAL